MSHHSTTAGWGALFSGQNAIRSLTLVSGVALHAINVFIATTILPTVVTDIGGLDYYAWNTALFVTASILGSALVPLLLSKSSPRGAYVIAALIFGIGTMICGAAPSMPIMLVGRTIQGFGGGFLLALSYSMIRIVFEAPLWPRAIALVSGMWGVATLIGPAIGGIFAELGVWRAAFWSLIPVIVLFAYVSWRILPATSKQAQSADHQVAWPQLALLTGSVLIVSAASLSADLLWNIAGVGLALVLIAVMILLEHRLKVRILPEGSFCMDRLGAIYLTMAMLGASVTSSEVFIPLFLQILHQQSPLVAGYLAAIMGGTWTIGSIASSGQTARKIDIILVSAPILVVLGLLTLALYFPAYSAGSFIEILPLILAMSVVGFAVGATWPHLLTLILKRATPADQNLASASITMVQLFTTALGAALAGMITNLAGLSVPGGLAGTAKAAATLFSSLTVMALIAFVAAMILLRRNKIARRQES